jgi:hypothetical protein
MSYENPIVDEVSKQCPEIADERSNPYAKRLTGEEILNIICEANCTRLQEMKDHDKHEKGIIFKNY